MKERKNEARWADRERRWKIAIQIDGERRFFYSSTPGIRGKIEAERMADEWIRNGSGQPSMRFKELYAMYLEALQNRQKRVGRGSAQYAKMESIGRVWAIPRLGNKKIDRISNADYQRVIDAAYDAGRSRKTLLHISSLFTGVYKTARKNKIVLERPELLEIYQDAPTHERAAMSPESITALFEASQMQERGKTVDCYHIHAFRVMCLLGLRRGEAAGLKWSDIKDGFLNVKRSVNNLGEITPGKTKAANRTIFLFPLAMKEFEEQRAYQRRLGVVSPWIFANPYNGLPDYDGLGRQWEIFCRSNGIRNVTLHELRHTTVSAAMGRISSDLLKPVIGHTKSMDTFGVYGHESEDNLKLVGDTFQKIFEEILKK